MDTVNISALVFSAIAAVAAVTVARWEWLDRPGHTWRFSISRDRWSTPPKGGRAQKVDHEKDPYGMTIKVFCEGDIPARDVRLRPVGVYHVEAPEGIRSVTQSMMMPGGDPLEINCQVPSLEEQKEEPYLEVVWTTLRPLREHGERISLRRYREHQHWRWYWRSLRPRRREGEGWWRYRLVRTQGRWVRERRNPLATVPWPHGPITYL
ncbi:hypothetical protein [Nocardiopsis sp. FR26]|uniref:hypothetical protein n=1 Tax=Nocardiopsis sp. FR26 TaxID=2605987 RepID=UPI001356FE7D|nr:hypothetical protein [Nocardiopsis sp. FR26]